MYVLVVVYGLVIFFVRFVFEFVLTIFYSVTLLRTREMEDPS